MSRLEIPRLHVADIELPQEWERLYDLAYNFWWSWTPRARRLFSFIGDQGWARYRNPVQMLVNVPRERWDALGASETFRGEFRAVIQAFDAYMAGEDTWFQRQHGRQQGDPLGDWGGANGRKGPIAYFSMEYGVHQCLAIYSGGLGVLSGDHCKSASDLGLPFVAVGLLYRHGYFQQAIDADGLQQHIYPEYDFTRLPLRPAASGTGRPVIVQIPVLDRVVHAKLWVAQIGRVPLVLLDTDILDNDPADRSISDILYVRGREMRLVQEMVLGVGGVRALRALGIEPSVWHMNEGHCSLLQLERLRELRQAQDGDANFDFDAGLVQLRRSTVFTTHTPVPAGNEQFDAVLAARYLEPWAETLGTDVERLQRLGWADGGMHQSLNLTALALRTTSFTNGVSQLNAEVVNRMWQHLYQEPEIADYGPIVGITNGIHTATWLGPELRDLLRKHLGEDWQDLLLDEEGWRRVLDIPDAEIWRVHLQQKERLARFMRSRLREQFARHGCSPDELRAVEQLFDPGTLTLAFARRFATYKRASLLFSDLVRLRTLLNQPGRPVQILFAGKAHPADRPGQELIEHIFKLSKSDKLRGKVFFVENYDMRVGAMLVQGADVWVNTPRRPLEASGTSGQKAAANGALNLSISDGWWPEGFDGENGWVIGSDDEYHDQEQQDLDDAASFYQLLEDEVVPSYYDEGEDGIPRAWIQRMKRAILLAPKFSSNRMVHDYVEQAYAPAHQRYLDLLGEG